MDHEQRERRTLKRILKRKGNQRVRRQLKRDLLENPAEAHLPGETDYGRFRSAEFNGLDHDSTRRDPSLRPPPEPGPTS